MNQPLKMHRTSSVIAAVLMILSQVLNMAALLSGSGAYDTPFFIIRLLGNALITVALSVILFRGRKDIAAGVVLLITIIAPVLSVSRNLLIALLDNKTILYTLACILSGLTLAAFRGLSALECLSKGKISAGGGRVLLWLLPILCFCFELWGQILLSLYNGANTSKMITSSLVYIIPQWVGPILMGVSLSVPGKRKEC